MKTLVIPENVVIVQLRSLQLTARGVTICIAIVVPAKEEFNVKDDNVKDDGYTSTWMANSELCAMLKTNIGVDKPRNA